MTTPVTPDRVRCRNCLGRVEDGGKLTWWCSRCRRAVAVMKVEEAR